MGRAKEGHNLKGNECLWCVLVQHKSRNAELQTFEVGTFYSSAELLRGRVRGKGGRREGDGEERESTTNQTCNTGIILRVSIIKRRGVRREGRRGWGWGRKGGKGEITERME